MSRGRSSKARKRNFIKQQLENEAVKRVELDEEHQRTDLVERDTVFGDEGRKRRKSWAGKKATFHGAQKKAVMWTLSVGLSIVDGPDEKGFEVVEFQVCVAFLWLVLN